MRSIAKVIAGALVVVGVAACASQGEKKVAAPKMDIVDTAVSAKSLNTLFAAVKAADLVDTLKGKGPLYCFRPDSQSLRTDT